MRQKPSPDLMSGYVLFSLGAWFLLTLTINPANSETSSSFFPAESFKQLAPTLPNEKLNFNDDTQNSCCTQDYSADGAPVPNTPARIEAVTQGFGNGTAPLVWTEFERVNPSHVTAGPPNVPVSCNRLADLPMMVSNGIVPSDPKTAALPIAPYSTNVSRRSGAAFKTSPESENTSDFHIEASGGNSRIALQDVNSYSVCLARGNNDLIVGNSDNGSIMTYTGNDRILLAGENTNMFTRTGDGEDTIELMQAEIDNASPAKSGPDAQWRAYKLFKTAVSGGAGTDHLVIKDTPFGTKWCYIGRYHIYGETFHVVEFALPPTVTSGPRRQRVNIGHSIEYVSIKGKHYTLKDFLSHGEPTSTIAELNPDSEAPRGGDGSL